MSDPFGFPFGMDPDALRDAPLFRELQRVMASGGGPINWELARQVGVATAVESGNDPEPTDEDRRILDEAVRVAELHVARSTGLEPPPDVAPVRAVRRSEWVGLEADGLRSLLEPAATRMSEALERAMRDQMPEETAGVGTLLSQLGPLLQGSQVGQVFGSLAQRVLGRYDVPVPREGKDELVFVVANLRAFEDDWSLDPVEFRTCVAIHEVTHRFEFARPWVREHLAGLVDDFLSTVTIDVAAIQERFASIDPNDPEAVQRVLGGEDEGALFGAVLNDEQRLKLGRVQAFVTAAEGYGDHVVRMLGAEILPSFGKIEEALRRRREGQGAEPVFERLLGIEMQREHDATGDAFCDTVVEQTDESTLSRMWDSPEALPGLAELDEPRLWLARTV